jgi:hypothetical protein
MTSKEVEHKECDEALKLAYLFSIDLCVALRIMNEYKSLTEPNILHKYQSPQDYRLNNLIARN